jgi:hypothetical protein
MMETSRYDTIGELAAAETINLPLFRGCCG